jgi:hypothetical protein
MNQGAGVRRSLGRRATFGIGALLLGLVPMVAARPVAALPSGASGADPTDGIVVKLRADTSGATVARSVGAKVDVGLARNRAVLRLGRGASLGVALAQLQRDPRVEWAEPNVRYQAAVVPNDPCLNVCPGSSVRQWAPAVVHAPEAWDLTHGSPSVVVAVIDGGVDAGHSELKGKVVVGPDFTGEPADDCSDHATHVAGTIAATTNDGTFVAGLGWDTKVLSIRVLSEYPECSGTLSSIAKAIDTAVEAGARVINLSLAGSFDSRSIRESIAKAVEAGVVVVAAAGNEGLKGNPIAYPAAIGEVLSVGASTVADETAAFSEHGGWVDMAAPGEGIVSTVPGGYALMSGTSMAAPHVAAAAALIIARSPKIGADAVVARLQLSSDDHTAAGRDVRYGRLNMARALSDSGDPGYYMVATDGGIFAFGGKSGFYGSTGSIKLNQPIVGMTPVPRRKGYWFVASDGGIFNYGDAPFFGSMGGKAISAPIVGMAAMPDSKGYLLFGADGRVYGFGSAAGLSRGADKGGSRIVGGGLNLIGTGYWLVSAGGGVISVGDAKSFGDMAGSPLNRPIVGMAVTPSGLGYWLVATDGGIFGFGDAAFFGSTGAMSLNQPIVGMASSITGNGYWLVASDGGIFAYGDARFSGSMGGKRLNQPVVGIG